ncbi:hypothetical protein Tco_1166170 [Tanacetum coccineum]
MDLSEVSLSSKFERIHYVSACALEKVQRKPHKPKSKVTNQGKKSILLHMDLCGPMRCGVLMERSPSSLLSLTISSDMGKMFAIKDEAQRFIINLFKRGSMNIMRKVSAFSHENQVARSPQQNGVVGDEISQTALREMDPGIQISSGLVPKPLLLLSPLSTLRSDWDFLILLFDAFHHFCVPKNYKEALTQACWIEAMQEELHEFERLEVWKLVPPPDKALVITL